MTVLVDAHVTLGRGHMTSMTTDDLLAQMDRHGVGRAVISPPDRCLAVANREGDEAIAATCRANPDRFIGAAGVNPWYGDDAVDELRRAVDDGLRMLVIHPPIQGFALLDGVVDPLLAVAEELAIPVYVHTGTPVGSLPLQLSVIARRFPSVPFLMGHMGHSDFWLDAMPAALGAPNIVAEISYKQPLAIREAVTRLGAHRVVFGSDAPHNDLGLEVRKFRLTDLTQEERTLVGGLTLLRILGLDPSAGGAP